MTLWILSCWVLNIFWIPINIFKLCSQMQLFVNTDDPFRPLFLAVSSIWSRLHFLHYKGKTLQSYSNKYPVNYEVSSLAFGTKHYSQLYVISGHCSLWSFQVFFSRSQVVSSNAHTNQHKPECLKGSLYTSLKFSLRAVLSSLIFYSAKPSHLGFPRFLVPPL